jgi:glycosyl transferase family 25
MSGTRSVYVINLEHRTDRRTEMHKQLSAVGWSAEFFRAVLPDSAADFPSIGARGCFLSHLSVLKKARDAGTQELVILEDDLNFVAGFAELWAAAMSELERRQWSIFYSGHGRDDLPSGLTRISCATGMKCTHFMVINARAISALIGGFEDILSRPAGHPMGGPMHVDGAYSTIRSQNDSLITYAHFPVLGYQRPSRTDVGDLKWFDRIGLLTPIGRFVRKLMR